MIFKNSQNSLNKILLKEVNVTFVDFCYIYIIILNKMKQQLYILP